MRVLLDTNVLVASLISRRGAPAQLVERWFAGDFELIVCPKLLAETERALAYEKIARFISSDVAARFVAVLAELGEVVADPTAEPRVHSLDPDDDCLIALAAREKVLLVSGDRHLLELRGRIPVSSPRELLDQLGT